MSKQVCSICKREENERSMMACNNCASPMCSDCYKKYNGNCNCTAVVNNTSIEII